MSNSSGNYIEIPVDRLDTTFVQQQDPPPSLPEAQKRIIQIGTAFFLLVFTGSSIFLLVDHFKYPHETPDDIATARDVCAIAVLVSTFFLSGLLARYIALQCADERKGWIALLTVLIFYVICAIFWAFYHLYYTVAGRDPPYTVHVLKMIAMFYVIIATIVLYIIALAKEPQMALICCFLFMD